MHWHILGVGAIGSLWAIHWHRVGIPVTLLWQDQERLQRFQEAGGLTFEQSGHAQTYQLAAQTLREPAAPIENLLVTLKAYATLPALEALRPRLAKVKTVVLLQNGLGQHEEVLGAFPQLPLLLATTTSGAYRRSSFHTIQAGIGTTWLGEAQGEWSSEQRTPILEAWKAPGWPINWESPIWPRLWQKLALNSCINPLTALLQCHNGRLADLPAGKELLRTLYDEVERFWQAAKFLPFDPPLAEALAQVLERTAENQSSMWQDLQRGLPTEVAYINGYLVRQAQKLGISLPYHSFLIKMIQFQEQSLDQASPLHF